jgi:hypothetical protein
MFIIIHLWLDFVESVGTFFWHSSGVKAIGGIFALVFNSFLAEMLSRLLSPIFYLLLLRNLGTLSFFTGSLKLAKSTWGGTRRDGSLTWSKLVIFSLGQKAVFCDSSEPPISWADILRKFLAGGDHFVSLAELFRM